MAAADTMRVLVSACAAETDGTLNTYLALAAKRLNYDADQIWGTSYEEACCYLAGHFYMRSQQSAQQNGAGPVTSESSGGMSRSYGAISARMGLSDAVLSTTIPGQEFLALRNSLVPAAHMLTLSDEYAI